MKIAVKNNLLSRNFQWKQGNAQKKQSFFTNEEKNIYRNKIINIVFFCNLELKNLLFNEKKHTFNNFILITKLKIPHISVLECLN